MTGSPSSDFVLCLIHLNDLITLNELTLRTVQLVDIDCVENAKIVELSSLLGLKGLAHTCKDWSFDKYNNILVGSREMYASALKGKPFGILSLQLVSDGYTIQLYFIFGHRASVCLISKCCWHLIVVSSGDQLSND